MCSDCSGTDGSRGHQRDCSGGDDGHSGADDLAIGVPFEDFATAIDAGLTNILYGSASALTATGAQAWSLASPNIAGTPSSCDEYGFALTP